MKTHELIEEIHNLGLCHESYSSLFDDGLTVNVDVRGMDVCCARVSTRNRHGLSMFEAGLSELDKQSRGKLFSVLTKYSRTPVYDRGDTYFVIPLPGLFDPSGSKQYLTKTCTGFFAKERDDAFKQIFGKYELEDVPSEYRSYAKVVEKKPDGSMYYVV